MSYRLVLVSFIVAFFFRYKYPRTLLFYHSFIILSYGARHGVLNSYIKLAGKGPYITHENFLFQVIVRTTLFNLVSISFKFLSAAVP